MKVDKFRQPVAVKRCQSAMEFEASPPIKGEASTVRESSIDHPDVQRRFGAQSSALVHDSSVHVRRVPSLALNVLLGTGDVYVTHLTTCDSREEPDPARL